MADNVYDFLNKFKLSDVGRALAPYLKPSGLPAYAMSGPEYQRRKEAAMSPLERRAMYGPLGDMESENIPTYDSASGKYIYDGMVADSGKPPAAPAKTYEATPESQYERLFKDQAVGMYGDLSKAKGAPKGEQAMLELARQTSAPVGTDLSAYYAAQRGAGEVRSQQLQDYFGQKSPGLGEWAKANPELAYRQFLKESGRTGVDKGTEGALEMIGKAEPSESKTTREKAEDLIRFYTQEAADPLAPGPINGRAFNF